MKHNESRYFYLTEGRIANQRESRIAPAACITIHPWGTPEKPDYRASFDRFIRGENGNLEDVKITHVLKTNSQTSPFPENFPTALAALKGLKSYIRKNGVR